MHLSFCLILLPISEGNKYEDDEAKIVSLLENLSSSIKIFCFSSKFSIMLSCIRVASLHISSIDSQITMFDLISLKLMSLSIDKSS